MAIKTGLDNIISLSKRRGFIYPGSDIYGGLSGTWDYGPLGVMLKKNIESLWWETFVDNKNNIYPIQSAILMNSKTWKASGHIDTFVDPLIEDLKTKKRYRIDQLIDDNGYDSDGMSFDQMVEFIEKHHIKSPEGNKLANPKQFNLMFKAHIGPIEDKDSVIYLRPETAQGMFVNFKNIIDNFYPDLPFGISQIGKSFRNEISPRDFLFRSRELEIMEYEYFVNPKSWKKIFDELLDEQYQWFLNKIGLKEDNLKKVELPDVNRAHYSSRTVDFEYKYPFGFKEIGGISYRGDYDLKRHQNFSNKSMEYEIKGTQERFIPHVIEPTFGLDRIFLAILCDSYSIDQVNGENRVYLNLNKTLSPYLVSVSPLLKNKEELVSISRDVYNLLKKDLKRVNWDDNGNIGKRYRRQDEIGTPYCVTIDFDSLKDQAVTVRDRNSTKQERIKIDQLIEFFNKD